MDALGRTIRIEPQLPTHPGDRAPLADEAHEILPTAGRPREEHRDEAVGILEQHAGRVLDLVAVMPQPPRPRAHSARQPGDVESLVYEMRAVVDEHAAPALDVAGLPRRSEEHTSELQSQSNLVCRLLLEKKK